MKLSKCKNGKIIVRMIIALALLIFSGPLFGADLRITWNANTETDLAGYTLNYVIPGDSGWTLANGQWTYTGPFTHIVELGKVTDWTLTNATPGPYAAVLRAKDTSGNLSDYSAVVQALVPTPPTAPVVIPIDIAPGKVMTITITVQ